jgi:DNA-binding PadR family transcriptional regulator
MKKKAGQKNEPIRRSPLAVAVLALLIEEPMHAYRMQQLIKERAKDDVVNVAQRNSIYQTIARVVREDLARVKETSRDENRPERVVYEITPLGATTLDAWLEAMLTTPAREFPEFPAALSFVALLSPSKMRACLETRRAALSARLAAARAAQERASKMGLPRLFLLEDEYRNALTKAELYWLDGVIADLHDKKLTWNRAWIRDVARRMAQS